MELSCAVAGGGGGGGGGASKARQEEQQPQQPASTATATTTATTTTATTTAPGSLASPPGAPAAGLLLASALGTVEDDEYESLPPSASFGTHMTAGAVAGILEHTVMYPVDFVKAGLSVILHWGFVDHSDSRLTL
ncbi:hypothetical protein JRQ81_011076 [Phrynocephalus forsythii]|uniref:Mitoferrin-1 n=1 Tax=Phrynocephalus forsythii TaxID=171643 RepID=A0A9Q0X7I2_9SAUR|nr:hypothetical protein JRQ81_011076 [Phrynocephalus forsythii]